jgi:hypothetical protein
MNRSLGSGVPKNLIWAVKVTGLIILQYFACGSAELGLTPSCSESSGRYGLPDSQESLPLL